MLYMSKIKRKFQYDAKQLEEFCQKNHLQKLSFFGSALRDDFGPHSDIDVLVEFESFEATPNLVEYVRLIERLSALLGRKVDMVTPLSLKGLFKEEVLRTAEVVYDKRA